MILSTLRALIYSARDCARESTEPAERKALVRLPGHLFFPNKEYKKVKRTFFLVVALMISAGATFGQQPATNDRPVMTYRSSGQPASRGRRVTQVRVEEIRPNYPENYDGPRFSSMLDPDADLPQLRNILAELAFQRRWQGEVTATIQFVPRGAFTARPNKHKGREISKKLKKIWIEEGSNAASDQIYNRVPYGYGGDAAARGVRRSGDAIADAVGTPSLPETWYVVVSISAVNGGLTQMARFEYNVTREPDGSIVIQMVDGHRLNVLGYDESDALHLAENSVEIVPHNENLGLSRPLYSAGVALVEAGRR